jgi:hypothetical protein
MFCVAVIAFLSGANAMLLLKARGLALAQRFAWIGTPSSPGHGGGWALELTLPMSAAVRVTTDFSEAGGF